MRLIRYHEKGAPEVMRLEEAEIPAPAAGQLQMKIEAVGVAFGDTARRGGRHYPLPTPLPHIPGGFCAGYVTEVGPDVDKALIGQRMIGNVWGGYAEYGVGPAAGFKPLPTDVPAVEAVAILSDGTLAGVMLKTSGQLKAGQSVFVPAAAGGLGFVAIQLARIYGAGKVLGGASSDVKRAAVESVGAIAIDYTKENWSKDVIEANGGAGVDLALEMTGGPIFYETLEAVRNGGRIVNYGNASDTDSPVNPRLLFRKGLTLTGFSQLPYAAQLAETREEVLQLLRDGKLDARATTYRLEDAADAHRAIEGRASIGRQVLIP